MNRTRRHAHLILSESHIEHKWNCYLARTCSVRTASNNEILFARLFYVLIRSFLYLPSMTHGEVMSASIFFRKQNNPRNEFCLRQIDRPTAEELQKYVLLENGEEICQDMTVCHFVHLFCPYLMRYCMKLVRKKIRGHCHSIDKAKYFLMQVQKTEPFSNFNYWLSSNSTERRCPNLAVCQSDPTHHTTDHDHRKCV